MKYLIFFLIKFTLSAITGSLPQFNQYYSQIKNRTVNISIQGIDGKFHQHCTGYIQTDGLVITAGHCLEGINPQKNKIRLDFYDIKSKSMVSTMATNFNSKFDIDAGFDIGKIFFEAGKSPINSSILIGKKIHCDPNSKFYISGYGTNKKGGSGNFDVISYKFSDDTQKKINIPSTFFLLDKTHGINCNRDSGAPVFCESKGKVIYIGILNGGVKVYSQKKEKEKVRKIKDKTPPEIIDGLKMVKDCNSSMFIMATKFESVAEDFYKLNPQDLNSPEPVTEGVEL